MSRSWRRVVGRLGVLAVFLATMNAATFWASRQIPGDPLSILASGAPAAMGSEAVASLRRSHGLDLPLRVQYVRYLARLLAGDWGRSITTGRPVTSELTRALPPTLLLATAALFLAAVAGLGLGLLGSKGPRWGAILETITSALTALPSAGAGIILIWLFSANTHLLPSFGMFSDPGRMSPGDFFAHLVLPAVTLSLHTTALLAKTLREELSEVLDQDYIRTAVAKGLRPATVFARHALRNALTPVLSIATIQAGSFLSGSAVVETLFSWPGLGWLMARAVANRDYPLLQGAVMLAAFAFFLAGAAGDVLQSRVDPRLR